MGFTPSFKGLGDWKTIHIHQISRLINTCWLKYWRHKSHRLTLNSMQQDFIIFWLKLSYTKSSKFTKKLLLVSKCWLKCWLHESPSKTEHGLILQFFVRLKAGEILDVESYCAENLGFQHSKSSWKLELRKKWICR